MPHPNNEMTIAELNFILYQAEAQARVTANATYEKVGERDCCGFGWVQLKGVRGNTKLGKKLTALGVKRDHENRYYWWSTYPSQSMSVNEAWADGFASVLKEHGFDCWSLSRMD